MISKIINPIFLSIAAVLFALAGCGGGGGGEGGGGTTSSYKGNTSQAVLNTGNAKVLSVDAIEGTQDASAFGVIGKSVDETSHASLELSALADIFEASIVRMLSKSTVAKSVSATVQGTMNGDNGTLAYSGDFNESTGIVTGVISFNQYRELPTTALLSGKISFNGAYNQTIGTFTRLNITMVDLQSVKGTASFTLNGSMSANNPAGLTKSLTMSIVILNIADNRTYWVKDFSLALTGNKLAISGTYYDHVHGFVVISTVTPLTVSSYSTKPTSGELQFAGRNGTKARLTYTTSGYILEIDTSGNNTYILVP